MSKPRTHLLIVLDSSSSMESRREVAVNFFNEEVDQARLNAEEQEIDASLVTFNGQVFEHKWLVPVSEIKRATLNDYQPVGSTALFDAVGYSIQNLEALTEGDKECAYLVVIITDGENTVPIHQCNYKPEDVKNLIAKCEATGRWTISFLGCDQGQIYEFVKSVGLGFGNVACYNNATPMAAATDLGKAAYSKKAFYGARSRGVLNTANLYSMDTEKVANLADQADVPVEETVSLNCANLPEGSNNVFEGRKLADIKVWKK